MFFFLRLFWKKEAYSTRSLWAYIFYCAKSFSELFQWKGDGQGGSWVRKKVILSDYKREITLGKHFLFCKNLSRSYSSGKVMDRGEAGLEKRWFSLTTKEKSLWADIFYFCYFGIVLTDFNCRGSNFNLTSFSIVIFLTDKTLFFII